MLSGRSSDSSESWRTLGSSGIHPLMNEKARETVYELNDLLVQPGTYFNPQTEVLVVVDDSASMDQEIFNMEAYEGADWIRIAEDVPVDEEQRDELLERFQTHYHPGGSGSLSEVALDQDDGEEDEGEEGQDPGRED
jgi:hypothetical protein